MSWFFWLFILIEISHGSARCGFQQIMQYQNSVRQKGLTRSIARMGSCAPEDLYDTVFVRTTEHFRILYTFSGPHAIPPQRRDSALDSLSVWLENAWDLHTRVLGMRPPLGKSVSHHYRDNRFPEKYPVEIIDIGLMRDTWEMLGGPCGACYGITIPDPTDFRVSTLLIENDFLYQEASDPLTRHYLDTGSCTYTRSNRPIRGSIGGQSIDYSQFWIQAMKITTFHELYHGCQLRYQNYEDQFHFWFEASATGVEDVAVPQANDYLQYLSPIFNATHISLINTADPYRPYGQSVFYHRLRYRFGERFDARIWEKLEKAPRVSITLHMDSALTELGAEDGLGGVLHDHARSLVFSGTRASVSDALLWHADQSLWPDLRVQDYATDGESFEPFSFRVYKDFPTNRHLLNRRGLRLTTIQVSGQTLLVASTDFSPITLSNLNSDQKPKSWPNPWRGNGLLFFDPLNDARALYIRTADGDPVQTLTRIDTSRPFRWDGIVSGLPLRPGVYYWNTEKDRRPRRFIVIR